MQVCVTDNVSIYAAKESGLSVQVPLNPTNDKREWFWSMLYLAQGQEEGF